MAGMSKNKKGLSLIDWTEKKPNHCGAGLLLKGSGGVAAEDSDLFCIWEESLWRATVSQPLHKHIWPWRLKSSHI